MDMNDNILFPQESFDSNPNSLTEVNNSLIQNHPLVFLGYQVSQGQNEASNTYSLPQGRTLLNAGEYQQFAVNGLPHNFIYRGRSITRGNISTASSLSPVNKVPQNPVNILVMLPSTKSTMSGGQIVDQFSDDETDMNEHPAKAGNVMKSSKNVADVDNEENQTDERENNVEVM